MDRVEQIEAAITRLPPDEYRRLVDWFRVREESRRDSQEDEDSGSGRLDALFREAEDESAQGLVRASPPAK
ncbi:MAG: hypothetical protein U0Q16_23060 [Bryobacteraceae bacterium]